MSDMHFDAPWGWKLKVSTTLACFVVGVPAIYQLALGRWIGIVLTAVLASSVPFLIRGYTVTATHLEIQRLFWTTRWPLIGLREVYARPGVMAWSWRTWGNGGLFAIHGWFSNGQLGRYRAFVTDPDRAVVLRFTDSTVVVSPDDPARLVHALQGAISKASLQPR
jgi:Bacterial PH domain